MQLLALALTLLLGIAQAQFFSQWGGRNQGWGGGWGGRNRGWGSGRGGGNRGWDSWGGMDRWGGRQEWGRPSGGFSHEYEDWGRPYGHHGRPHHQWGQNTPQPPPPPPQMAFPSDTYNQLPDDVLGDALCFLLAPRAKRMSRRQLRIKMMYRGYSYSKTEEVLQQIGMLRRANFKFGLSCLGNEAYMGLSDPGKQMYCNLFQNMPDAFATCGFEQLTGILTEMCGNTSDPQIPVPPPPPATVPPFVPPTLPPVTTTQAAVTSTSTAAATTTAASTTTALSCGDLTAIRNLAVTTRIVGGVAAQQGAYDSYASLTFAGQPGPGCGATIIDSCTILTAAHCVDGVNAGDITVNVGDHTTSNLGSTSQTAVNQIIMHENYASVNGAPVNDLAILKVDPIEFTNIQHTAPACLATADVAVIAQQGCTTVGVGTTSFGGQQPGGYRLQEVTVPTYSGTVCNSTPSILVAMSDPNNQICAGSVGKDSCQGDSGGPLYCQQDGQQVLTGIVSYGSNCGQDGYPGVYVDVASYQNWISQNSGC